MTKNEDTGGLVDCSARGIIDIIYDKRTNTIRHKSNVCLVDFDSGGRGYYYCTQPTNPDFFPMGGKYNIAIYASLITYNKNITNGKIENNQVNKWGLAHLILKRSEEIESIVKDWFPPAPQPEDKTLGLGYSDEQRSKKN